MVARPVTGRDMADLLEQMRIWRRRIRRRRWRGLAVAWATCVLGWSALGLIGIGAGAALHLGAVLLAGIAAGCTAAAFAAGREPVFDSVEQLRGTFARPVLGAIADTTARAAGRADLRFAMACIGLLGACAGLLMLPALAPEGP